MSDYAATFLDGTGTARLEGTLEFTDPDNQPATVNQPFKPAPGDTIPIVKDSAGDVVLDYDDANGQLDVNTKLVAATDASIGGTPTNSLGFFGAALVQRPTGDLAAALSTLGLVASPVLGASTVYVTVGTADPTTYTTPLVVNTTAVTGGSFAWDGSAYQRISAALT